MSRSAHCVMNTTLSVTSHKAHRTIFEIYFDYVQHYGGSIHIASLLQLTSELGLPVTTVRSALCRMTAQGWFERTVENNRSYYALTRMGRERLEEARPRIFAHHSSRWDGQWTILTYSLPERLRHHRDRLRHELNWLGFGPLNSATWISPKAVVEVTLRHLAIRKLDPHVQIFRGHQVSGLVNAALVRRCWNLDAVQAQYRHFINAWEPRWLDYAAKFRRGQPPAENVCFATRIHLLHQFGEFLHNDPELPSELLPEGWLGDEAWHIFRDCYLLLAERALHYFEHIFEGPSQTHKEQQEGRQRVLQGFYEAV